MLAEGGDVETEAVIDHDALNDPVSEGLQVTCAVPEAKADTLAVCDADSVSVGEGGEEVTVGVADQDVLREPV